jgi:hypothetical protein
LPPLVGIRLSRYTFVLLYCIVNTALQVLRFLGELSRDSSEELASMTNVATTFGEEEAGTKTTLLKAVIGDSTGNRGFSCAS